MGSPRNLQLTTAETQGHRLRKYSPTFHLDFTARDSIRENFVLIGLAYALNGKL